MFSRHNRVIGLFYLAVDALLAFASFGLAYWIRLHGVSPRPLYEVSNYFWIIPLCPGLWIAVSIVLGVYREIREEDLSRAFIDPIKVGLIATTLLFAFTSALKLEYISRLLLVLYAALDLGAMISFRLAGRWFSDPLRRAFAGLRYFLLVGETREARDIAKLIEANESRGMRLFAFVRVGAAAEAGISNCGVGPEAAGTRREYPVYPLESIPELLRRHVIDEVIFAVSKDDLERVQETLLVCEEEGVRTRLLLTFLPHVISKVQLDRLQEMSLLTFSTTPESEDLLLLKRVVDFIMALVFLVALSPLFVVLAILIK